MDIYTVSLFGHKKIHNHYKIEAILEEIVRDLLTSKDRVEFLVGRDGEFDLLAACVVRRVKNKTGHKNSSLTLVLPYATKHFHDNEKEYFEYFDDVKILSESDERRIKGGLRLRNKYLADRSDMVICYVESDKDSAYQAEKYAESLKRRIVNVTNL